LGFKWSPLNLELIGITNLVVTINTAERIPQLADRQLGLIE